MSSDALVESAHIYVSAQRQRASRKLRGEPLLALPLRRPLGFSACVCDCYESTYLRLGRCRRMTSMAWTASKGTCRIRPSIASSRDDNETCPSHLITTVNCLSTAESPGRMTWKFSLHREASHLEVHSIPSNGQRLSGVHVSLAVIHRSNVVEQLIEGANHCGDNLPEQGLRSPLEALTC